MRSRLSQASIIELTQGADESEGDAAGTRCGLADLVDDADAAFTAESEPGDRASMWDATTGRPTDAVAALRKRVAARLGALDGSCGARGGELRLRAALALVNSCLVGRSANFKVERTTSDDFADLLGPWFAPGVGAVLLLAVGGFLAAFDALVASPLLGPKRARVPCACRLCAGAVRVDEKIGEGGFGAVWRCATPAGVVLKLGVVHRDIKLENVFVLRGTIKIGDFGLAVAAAAGPARSGRARRERWSTRPGLRSSSVGGTEVYQPPECFADGDADGDDAAGPAPPAGAAGVRGAPSTPTAWAACSRSRRPRPRAAARAAAAGRGAVIDGAYLDGDAAGQHAEQKPSTATKETQPGRRHVADAGVHGGATASGAGFAGRPAEMDGDARGRFAFMRRDGRRRMRPSCDARDPGRLHAAVTRATRVSSRLGVIILRASQHHAAGCSFPCNKRRCPHEYKTLPRTGRPMLFAGGGLEASGAQLLAAAGRGDAARVGELLEACRHAVHFRDEEGRTALHHAAAADAEACVALLLPHQPALPLRSERGDTALHAAAAAGAARAAAAPREPAIRRAL
ncbi:MAP kinase kinase kinase [Aureococcus anophagefferens]|uniref:MAP kinase kinase kinase n=1 Tax=Aureococcus anophagefferens TaxID=44056 RepID=A0ABR1GAF0_AURAN